MANTDFENVMLNEIRELKTEISQRLDRIESRMDSMDQRLVKVEHKLDIVMEQTAGLMEFRTETNQKLCDITRDQKSICHLLGEHEVAIRSLQRPAI